MIINDYKSIGDYFCFCPKLNSIIINNHNDDDDDDEINHEFH